MPKKNAKTSPKSQDAAKDSREKEQKKAAGGARAIWSGSIAFGLINIPVKLFSATQEYQLSFNQLRKSDNSRIKYMRVAAADGQEVPYDDIVKASPKKTQTIEILTFTNEDEIDSIFFEKPYYTAPEKNASRAYVLLREALKKSKKVAVCKFILRTKENLAILKPEGDALILNQIRFTSEVREREHLNLPSADAMNEKELDLALSLVDQLSEPFKPEQYRDPFTEEIKQIIEKKAQGIDITAALAAKPEPTDDSDLLKILQASIAKSKAKVDA